MSIQLRHCAWVGLIVLLPLCGGQVLAREGGLIDPGWEREIEADWLRQLVSRWPFQAAHAAGGCDGVKKGEITFHTDHEPNPWWQVDLGTSHSITRIVVYNTNQNPERARQLALLLSHDGKAWREVYRHDGQVFGGARDGRPLVVRLEGETARFVRAALPGGYLHLDEVEVYGPDAPERNLALDRPATLSSVHASSKAPASWKPVVRMEEEIPRALERAERLYADLRGMEGVPDLSTEAAALQRLREEVRNAAKLDPDAAQALYLKVRWTARNLALRNPLVSSKPILFMMRPRYGGHGQMLYEYVGWYYRSGRPNPDAGVYVLEQPGQTNQARALLSNAALNGHFVTLALSYDARTIYFALADPAGKSSYGRDFTPVPAQPGVKYHSFHIMAMNADGSQLRQLTDSPYDDFDPCPLPDGGLAFMSTRRGGKNRCGGGNPEANYTLHRMDADGRDIRTLSYHETNEWHPFVLNDGRILYTRWDYVDRDAACFHGLWTCNPDGSSPAILFGNYTKLPWACYQGKAIPGSDRILFVGGGHHSLVGGTLALLDPSRISLDAQTGHDRLEALELLTPEVCFPESQGWPASYFYSPWPLSENYYLVAFSHDPLHGQFTGHSREGETGLYYFDRFGNLELLFRRKGISAAYPIPLTPRPTPPLLPQALDAQLGEEGEFMVMDVNQSLFPLPSGRPITELRVFQLLPKSRTDRQDDPPISHQFAYGPNARMLLGTVPVEKDGSAYFRAPARKALYFQAVDESGRAVQSMLSSVYLQPGERRSCVGCHESPGTAPPRSEAAAFRRPASILRPGPDGSFPFGYPRLIQPVLDRNCVSCHDGSTGPDKSKLILTGEPEGNGPLAWSKSYVNLKPYLGLHMPTVSRPGQVGADRSRLPAILADPAHARHVKLPDEDLRKIYLWLDANAPFYGTYEEKDLPAQKLGHAVPPPALQ